MSARIPLVAYLALDPQPHLVALACKSCSAKFFDRRNACAACGAQDGFDEAALPVEGDLRTYTVVSVAAPGVPVPYVAGIVDLDGTSVRANIVNVPPDPAALHLGMKVRLATFDLGIDNEGVEAVGFGFEPIGGGES